MIQCNLPMKQFYKTKKSINQGLCQVNCSNSCFYCQRLKSNTCLKYKCWNDVNRVFKSLALESSIVYACLRWNRGLEREMVLPCLNKRTFSPLATGNLNSNYQQKGQFIPIMCRNSTGFQTLIRIFFKPVVCYPETEVGGWLEGIFDCQFCSRKNRETACPTYQKPKFILRATFGFPRQSTNISHQ